MKQTVCLRRHSHIFGGGGLRSCLWLQRRLLPVSPVNCPPADPGEPGGCTSEGGGGAAETVTGPQPGRERLRGGGWTESHRGEEVPDAPGTTEEEERPPHGLPGDPPVQPRRGGRDRKFLM